MASKKFLLLTTIILMFIGMQAQQISVKSFRTLPNDMDARQNYPVLDQNGDVCAIVKVVTNEKGFTFDIGSLGIPKTEVKTGEVWEYVPHGAKRISIFHDKLGVLRDYYFTDFINEGTCYELVLTTGKVITTILENEIQSQWLIINTVPPGADVYIDDQAAGKTPYQNELPVGKHSWRVQKELFLNDAGMVELFADSSKQIIDLKLKANYGTIQIVTEPEVNADIFMDGMSVNKTTPCVMDQVLCGDKIISAVKKQYQISEQVVSVKPDANLKIVLMAKATFGAISVSTDPESGALVSLDGQATGKVTPCTIEFIPAGDHYITLTLGMYETSNQHYTILAGETQSHSIKMNPLFAGVTITTDPEAEIFVNGELRGSGTWQGRLNPGIYTFEATLEKHETAIQKQKVVIGQPLNVTLNPKPRVGSLKIVSTPYNAAITLNGKNYGTTPATVNNLLIGDYNLILTKNGFGTFEKSIQIAENQVTNIREDLPSGIEIEINSKPQGAQVFANGVDIGKTPLKKSMNFGEYELKIMRGVKVVEQSVDLKPGGQTNFLYDVSDLAKVSIECNVSGATIFVDDKDSGIAPKTIELKPGIYHLKLEKYGFIKKYRTIRVSDSPDRVRMNLIPQGFVGLGWQWGEGAQGVDLMIIRKVGIYLSYLGAEPLIQLPYVNYSGFAFSGQLAVNTQLLGNFVLHGGYGVRIFTNTDITTEEKRYESFVFGATLPFYFNPSIGIYGRADYWTNTEDGGRIFYSVGIVYHGKR